MSCTDTGVKMPLAVSNYTIALVNNGSAEVLCTFGGRLSVDTGTPVVQCFDPLAKASAITSSLPGDLGTYMASRVAVLNNKVYVFGGFRHDPPLNSAQTWEWDPVLNNWTQKGNLHLARGFINVAVADGKIYAFGGDVYIKPQQVAQTMAEVFDPISGTWNDAAVADLATATGEGTAYGFNSSSSYTLAGKIIIAGGGQWPDQTAAVVQYNISTNSYSTTYPSLNVARANQAGFFIPGDPGRMWVFGGRMQAAGIAPYAPPEYSDVQLTQPNVVITPSELKANLFSGRTITASINLANQGSTALEWSLAISSANLFATSTVSSEPLRQPSGGGDNPITPFSPDAGELGKVIEPESIGMVLWDQPLSNINQKPYISQKFPDYPNSSSYLADDFVNDSVWSITRIIVPGDGWDVFSTLLNASSLTWQIYADHEGIPAGDPSGGGVPPLWSLTVPPTDTRVTLEPGIPGGLLSTTTLNLINPINLNPGHYWLVFYPTLLFESGQYGRQPADTTHGYVGQFINPGGDVGFGINWQDWRVLDLDTPLNQVDIAFRLEGELPWMGVTPITGIVPSGGSQKLTVTFNSSGMQPSINDAKLEIRTNDPEQPLILVPIRLKVTNGDVLLPITFKH